MATDPGGTIMSDFVAGISLIAYPGWAVMAFLSCAVRLLVYWQIRRSMRVLILAFTNLITFVGFALMCAVSHKSIWLSPLQPYLPLVWLFGLPFFTWSIWLEFHEILVVLRARSLWGKVQPRIANMDKRGKQQIDTIHV
jgi:hypothetical protein